jgi:hypothetical protein
VGQLFLNQSVAAMQLPGIWPPVPLYSFERFSGFSYGSHFDDLGVVPNILGPSTSLRITSGDYEVVVDLLNVTEFA